MSRKGRKPPRIGRPPKHGGYSLIRRSEIIGENKDLQQYLRFCREGLILDLGKSEDELSEGQRILVDRIMSKISLVRVLELTLAEHGIFRKEAGRTLEAEPVTALWLSVNNGIRADLQLLGIERRDHTEKPVDLGLYVETQRIKKAAGNERDKGAGGSETGTAPQGE